MATRSEANRRYRIDESFFDSIDTEAKAYFLGMLYADGYVYTSKNRNLVRLSLAEKDKQILDVLSKLIYEDRPLAFYKSHNIKHQGKYCLDISSKRICDSLKKHGCYQKKSYTLKYPKWISKNIEHHFIRGYFDGDGYVRENINRNRKAKFDIAGTERFCISIKKIFNRIGANIVVLHPNKERNNNIRVIRATAISGMISIRDYLYKDASIFLERKKSAFDKIEYKPHSHNRKIVQYNLDGQKIEDFDSMKSASIKLNIPAGRIRSACRSKCHKYYNFLFKYKQ